MRAIYPEGVSRYKNRLTTGAGLSTLPGVKGRAAPLRIARIENTDQARQTGGRDKTSAFGHPPGAERREEADKVPVRQRFTANNSVPYSQSKKKV